MGIYSLYGPDAAQFSIDSTSGVLKYLSPPAPNFEEKPIYYIEILSTDLGFKSFAKEFTITVTEATTTTTTTTPEPTFLEIVGAGGLAGIIIAVIVVVVLIVLIPLLVIAAAKKR